MKNILGVVSFSLVIVYAAQVFSAADGEGFQIFSNLQTQSPSPFSVDLDPVTPGRENFNINFFNCEISAPDGNNRVTATRSVSVSAASVDGVQVFKTAKATVATTKPFPDPRITNNQCGQPNNSDYHTSYESLDPVLNTNVRTMGCPAPTGNFQYGKPFTFDPGSIEFCSEFPRGYTGFGIATKDGTRVILVGVGLKGIMEQPAFEDVSAFTITAYNPNGKVRWTKKIPAEAGTDMRLFADWARVGDYLTGDGNDVIRIIYPGKKFRYAYYDVLTGELIKTVDVAR